MAVKRCKVKSEVERFIREFEILNKLSTVDEKERPNIVNFFGLYRKESGGFLPVIL